MYIAIFKTPHGGMGVDFHSSPPDEYTDQVTKVVYTDQFTTKDHFADEAERLVEAINHYHDEMAKRTGETIDINVCICTEGPTEMALVGYVLAQMEEKGLSWSSYMD